MSGKEIVYVKSNNAGLMAGSIASILAVLGILTIGTIFVPIAAVVALIGTSIAVFNISASGIGVNILAWVLIIAGVVTSPILLAFIIG